MTRNEWIAETARDLAAVNRTEYARSGEQNAMLIWAEIAWTDASTLADAAERRGQAPWHTPHQPAPALTDTAAKVVEAAELWLSFYGDGDYDGNDGRKARLDLKFAVRAHLAAKQGGAK